MPNVVDHDLSWVEIGRSQICICSVPHRTSQAISRFQAKQEFAPKCRSRNGRTQSSNIRRDPEQREPAFPRDIEPHLLAWRSRSNKKIK